MFGRHAVTACRSGPKSKPIGTFWPTRTFFLRQAVRDPDLGSLFRVFLKLGWLGFGGPAAHLALMEREIVRDRGWLEPGEFLDLIGAANLIPGPNSTEVALYVGLRRGGWRGLLLSGVGFISPAVLLVLGCAWAYVRFGALPPVEGVLRGVAPVVVAVVVHALWSFGRAAVRSPLLGVIGVTAVAGRFVGMAEIPVLLGAGLLTLVAGRIPVRSRQLPSVELTTAAGLFLFFLKVGAFVYGSGYVLLAFLQSGLVRAGWLTQRQLLDAIAIGQATPGPVFTTATFVGYLLDGVPGALAATAGIFLPAFVLVPASAALLPRLQSVPAARSFLDGVNVGAVALLVVVAVELAKGGLRSPIAVAAAGLALALLLRGVSAAWLMLVGALLGFLSVLG
jgi:chromate transporter